MHFDSESPHYKTKDGVPQERGWPHRVPTQRPKVKKNNRHLRQRTATWERLLEKGKQSYTFLEHSAKWAPQLSLFYTGPVWIDSSTTKQFRGIENAFESCEVSTQKSSTHCPPLDPSIPARRYARLHWIHPVEREESFMSTLAAIDLDLWEEKPVFRLRGSTLSSSSDSARRLVLLFIEQDRVEKEENWARFMIWIWRIIVAHCIRKMPQFLFIITIRIVVELHVSTRKISHAAALPLHINNHIHLRGPFLSYSS